MKSSRCCKAFTARRATNTRACNTSFRLLFHPSCCISGQREPWKGAWLRCPSILVTAMQRPGAQRWQWQTLTSPAAQRIPPCGSCSRQDSRSRVSGPLAFQQMQKMPSSKARRQAAAQRAPRRGALREVLSEKHMNFTFCRIA